MVSIREERPVGWKATLFLRGELKNQVLRRYVVHVLILSQLVTLPVTLKAARPARMPPIVSR